MIRTSEDGSVVRIVNVEQRVLHIVVGTVGLLLVDAAVVVALVIGVGAILSGAGLTGHHSNFSLYALVAVLLVVCAASVLWSIWRGARLCTELGPSGIVVRNPYRTYRIGWEQVLWFGNGAWHAGEGEGGPDWVLAIGTSASKRAICCRSTTPTKRNSGLAIIETVQQIATAHAIPFRSARERAAVAPGLTWLYDKLGWLGSDDD